MENGKLVEHLNDNKEKKIISITISQDDRKLAVSFEDSSIKVYHTQDWKFNELKQNLNILKIQFSHFNEDKLYFQTGNSFSEYTISTQNTINLIKDFDKGYFSLCKSKDFMAYANKTSLVIRNLRDKNYQNILEETEAPITALAISQDGEYFSTGKLNGRITIWQIQQQLTYHLKYHTDQIIFLQFLGDNELISAGSDQYLILWEFLQPNEQPVQIRKFDNKISGITIIFDLTIFVSVSNSIALNEALNLSFGTFSAQGDIFAYRSLNGTLQFVNTRQIKNKIITYKKAHNQIATAATFSKNDEYFAYGDINGKVMSLKKMMKNSLTFANKEKLLASGSIDMFVYVWDYENGSLLYTIKELNKPIHSIAFWIDDTMLSIGGELKKILLNQLDTNKIDSKPSHIFLEGHLLGINAVEFSPSGNTLVSASKDYCIKLWQRKKEKYNKPDKQIVVKSDQINSSDYDKKMRAIELFQNKIFCYQTIGLNYSFEANQVSLVDASIKNNEEESLLNNFQQSK